MAVRSRATARCGPVRVNAGDGRDLQVVGQAGRGAADRLGLPHRGDPPRSSAGLAAASSPRPAPRSGASSRPPRSGAPRRPSRRTASPRRCRPRSSWRRRTPRPASGRGSSIIDSSIWVAVITGMPAPIRLADDRLLDRRHVLGRHLHAEVAARHHHAVRWPPGWRRGASIAWGFSSLAISGHRLAALR